VVPLRARHQGRDGEAVVVGVGTGGDVVGAGVLAGGVDDGGVAEAETGGGLLGGVVVTVVGVTVVGGVAGEDLGGAVLAAGDVLGVAGWLLAGTGFRDGDGAAGTVRGVR
jgi:hypothetical protein